MWLARRQVVASTRGFIARSASSSSSIGDENHRHRVWRWGATAGGLMKQQEVNEISSNPSLMSEEFNKISTVACGSNHSAFVSNGCLYTYGSNKHHQLGWTPPATEDKSAEKKAEQEIGVGPEQVTIEASDGHRPKVLQVALGSFHSCAITEGGALWTWGWGGSFWSGAGALGQGSRDSFTEPTLVQLFVELGEEIMQVACGSQHTLVLTKNGRLFATGKGDFGRLGRGETSDELEFEELDYFKQTNDSLLHPNEPTEIIKVDAGENFCACLSGGGEIWVWGRNDFGQLGLGEEQMGDFYSAEKYPRLVRSLPLEGHQVVDFACGEHHLVALTSSGAIYEWGNRTWLEPHPVSLPSRYEDGLKDIIKVAAGDKVSFALTKKGELYSWGAKSSGCLALGPNCDKNIVQPTPVPAETFGHQPIIDVTASRSRCLAITRENEYAP